MDELQIEMPSNEPVITFRRRVAAHPDLVFRLFTEAQHLRRWWGPRRLELVECEIDLYIGGGYRLVQQAPDGQRFSFHGTYLAIERPHRLVQTFVYEGRPNNEVVETFSFSPVEGGTLVQCRAVHTSVEECMTRSGTRRPSSTGISPPRSPSSSNSRPTATCSRTAVPGSFGRSAAQA